MQIRKNIFAKNIAVVNRHTHTGEGIYVGRGTPLGNPYSTKKYSGTIFIEDLDECLNAYKTWLLERLSARDASVVNAMNDIYIRLMKGERVNLICSCKPKRCHGDTIRELVLEKLEG